MTTKSVEVSSNLSASNNAVATMAIRLNNEGVHQLQNEQHSAAALLFSRGLALVKRELYAFDPSTRTTTNDELASSGDSCDSHDDEEHVPRGEFQKLQQVSRSFSSSASTSASLQESITEDDESSIVRMEPYVFQEAINVEPMTLSRSSPVSYGFYVKLSFLQLYNLALANHLHAIHLSKDKSVENADQISALYKKAQSLYELAYTVHLTEDVELTVFQSMALVNNLGQVHQCLHQDEQAKKCFENLLSTLMFVRDQWDEQDSAALTIVLEGFLFNAMSVVQDEESKPAPAA